MIAYDSSIATIIGEPTRRPLVVLPRGRGWREAAFLEHRSGRLERISVEDYLNLGRRNAPALPPPIRRAYLTEAPWNIRALFELALRSQRGAIAYDNSITDLQSFVSSITIALTLTGSDRGLFSASFTLATGTTPTTATYNGVGMTAEAAVSVGGFGRGQGYILANPASGSNNLVHNFSNANTYVSLIAMSYTGVDQTTPSSGAASNSGNNTDGTLTVTSASGDLVAAALYLATVGFHTTTPGSGTNQRVTAGQHRFGGDEAGAASVTINWTWTVADQWMIVGTNIKQVSAAGAPKILPESLALNPLTRLAGLGA